MRSKSSYLSPLTKVPLFFFEKLNNYLKYSYNKQNNLTCQQDIVLPPLSDISYKYHYLSFYLIYIVQHQYSAPEIYRDTLKCQEQIISYDRKKGQLLYNNVFVHPSLCEEDLKITII